MSIIWPIFTPVDSMFIQPSITEILSFDMKASTHQTPLAFGSDATFADIPSRIGLKASIQPSTNKYASSASA